MHPSALNFGKLFFETYCGGLQGAVVHDVGAQDVNGSLKDVLPPHLGYVGVDFVAGKGVDIVLEDPYRLPFADASLDVLVCSSCFEHSQFFWLVFLEMLRVLKPQGLLYLNVPSNGSIHRYPVDCWRFYPDAGRALEAWAARNGKPAHLLESFVGTRSTDPYESGGAWHDFVAVFVNDARYAPEHRARMLDALPEHFNGYDSRTGAETRPAFLSPDHAVVVEREQTLAALGEQIGLRDERGAMLEAQVADRDDRLAALGAQLADRQAQVVRLGAQVASLAGQLATQGELLARERASAEEQRAVLMRAIDELTRAGRETREQLARAEQAVSTLQEQAAAANAYMDEVFRSRSWRFMAPARKAMDAARGVRSRLRALAARLRAGADVNVIRASGRFDEAFYRLNYPGLPPHADPIEHYCRTGWRSGSDPAPGFSTRYYLDHNADIRNAGLNPFAHYVAAGAAEGRLPRPAQAPEAARPAEPAPAAQTAPAAPRPGAAALPAPVAPMRARKWWRRATNALAAEVETIRKSGQFDDAYYLAMNPDLQPPPADPVRHYCEEGWLEGRNPSDAFNTNAYLETYHDIRDGGLNPFWHYITAGAAEFREGHPGFSVTNEDDIRYGPTPADVRVLAFHATPRWEQQRGARPLVGRDSLLPHSDLGYYDPAEPAVLKAQAVLARRHGIHGFCIPLTAGPGGALASDVLACVLSHPDVEIAFCPVLDLAPEWSGELDASVLAASFQDPRAVRVEQRPLLLVRVHGAGDTLSNALLRLREVLDGQAIGPLFLAACWADASEATLAEALAAGACDAVVDLPDAPMPRETGDYPVLDNHGVATVPYSVVAARGVQRAKAARDFPGLLYPAVALGRDETSSDAPRPLVYTRFHTSHYRRWLEEALGAAKAVPVPDQRFVFLQSWNDWNAGQVLEPDRRTGYGRLNETTRALLGVHATCPTPRVTVIVPNYNHERYLRRRLDSIYGQTYRNIEVILMDDCSTDGSRALMEEYAAAHPDITRTVFNDCNSGGVFRQWAKGIQAARGELVWIAESDDYCDERFLEVLVRCFDDEAVLLAYGHCEFVNKDETPIANEFQIYLSDLECAAKWNGAYVETAHREVRSALGVKNTIPNASAVVFRRPVGMSLLEQPWWLGMGVAGDWVFYLHVLRGGRIAFDPAATNYFRRYPGSTAETTYRKSTFYREVGLACREVAALYDVPLAVLERCRDGYRDFYRKMVNGSDREFEEWFDFDAALHVRAARVPNVMVSTMGFVPGGAEIFPIRLANEFKRQGVSVLLLSTGLSPREDGVRRLLRNDVPTVETADPASVQALIADFGIEVLNTHQWHVQKYPVRHAAVFSGLRGHVATLHGMIEHGSAFGVTEQEIRTADASVSTWVYTADKNLGPFNDLHMVEADASRFLKLPNGIQTPVVEPVPRANLGLPADAFVLCCVSRAIPDKGWAETIAAVERARRICGRDIRLVLVGNGPVHDEYRRQGVPPFVHLVGFSENSAGHYASADMGIMLTRFRSESFPLTILDCLFAGKPYIASNVGDIPNMLTGDDGVAGAVIALNDWAVPVEAAAQVIAAFASEAQRYEAARALVPRIASRYRIETVASQYLALFRQEIGAASAAAAQAAEAAPAAA